MLLRIFKENLDFFSKLSFNVVENVAKVEILIFFLFLAECHFSTLINYSTNMCWTSYEPTVCICGKHSISQYLPMQ